MVSANRLVLEIEWYEAEMEGVFIDCNWISRCANARSIVFFMLPSFFCFDSTIASFAYDVFVGEFLTHKKRITFFFPLAIVFATLCVILCFPLLDYCLLACGATAKRLMGFTLLRGWCLRRIWILYCDFIFFAPAVLLLIVPSIQHHRWPAFYAYGKHITKHGIGTETESKCKNTRMNYLFAQINEIEWRWLKWVHERSRLPVSVQRKMNLIHDLMFTEQYNANARSVKSSFDFRFHSFARKKNYMLFFLSSIVPWNDDTQLFHLAFFYGLLQKKR